MLSGAYFIAVAYYLVLLATFSTKILGYSDPALVKIVATMLIGSICIIGLTKGLLGVERAEKYSVSANLAAISALLIALVLFGINLPGGFSWTSAIEIPVELDWEHVRFLMGLLIIVQGFETSRYMGELYDADTRIRAMKRAQIVSSVVYVVFFILMVPLYTSFVSKGDVSEFIEVIGHVTPWLPFVVTIGAIASQFSASIADSIGGSGLVSDTTHGRINTRYAYILIGAVSIFVVWETNVVSLVALASRAFALFYALQCVVATGLAWTKGNRPASLWYGSLAAVSFMITVFGIPAEG